MNNIKVENEEIVVYPEGELDIYTSSKFKEDIIKVYEKNNKNILVDCKKLIYIDSTGLGSFMYISNKIKEKGHKLSLVNLNPSIKKLFLITKLDKVFEMRDINE